MLTQIKYRMTFSSPVEFPEPQLSMQLAMIIGVFYWNILDGLRKNYRFPRFSLAIL